MNIDYILLEETLYSDENLNDSELKARLNEFLSICEEIVQFEEENILYSFDLYDQYIKGVEFANWLYTDDKFFADEKKLLRLLIEQSFVDDDSLYKLYRSQINKEFSDRNIAAMHILAELEDLVPTKISVYEIEDCFKIRRLFLGYERDRINFCSSINRVFPKLYLGENVENTLRHFNPISDHIKELITHLTALNDHALNLFEEYSREGEAKVLNMLSSTTGIICSPEGNHQTVETYLKFRFKDNEGNIQQLSCSPHTKLYRADSNYRIYFTWNNNRLPGLPEILIGHIGGHPYP